MIKDSGSRQLLDPIVQKLLIQAHGSHSFDDPLRLSRLDSFVEDAGNRLRAVDVERSNVERFGGLDELQQFIDGSVQKELLFIIGEMEQLILTSLMLLDHGIGQA